MNQRQKLILQLLGEDRELSVSALTRRFQTSGVTIRQDLDYLQSQGLLRRVHGGAVLDSQEDIAHRLGINYESKLKIAELAATFIDPGDTILIEAGSANAILARRLAHRDDIRIITTNLFIARSLRDSPVEVLVIGGIYQHKSDCMVGSLARRNIEELHFVKAFIGTDGFDLQVGFTCQDMLRAEIAQTVVTRATESFVVTDSTKCGKVALSRICRVADVTHVITDDGIPDEYRTAVDRANATLHVAG